MKKYTYIIIHFICVEICKSKHLSMKKKRSNSVIHVTVKSARTTPTNIDNKRKRSKKQNDFHQFNQSIYSNNKVCNRI